jgi:hypothetical protein
MFEALSHLNRVVIVNIYVLILMKKNTLFCVTCLVLKIYIGIPIDV